jgi:ATP-dependent Zn protease
MSSRIERIRRAYNAADKVEGVTSETLLAALREAVPDATSEEIIQVAREQNKKIRRSMRRSLSRARPKTAIHEAGHAVALIILSEAFNSVTIVPADDGVPGHIAFTRGWLNKCDPQHAIVCMIAGATAQRLFFPRSHWRAGYGMLLRPGAVYNKAKLHDGTDFSTVLLLLQGLARGRRERVRIHTDCAARAHSLVETHQDKIEAVAAALLEHQTLSFDDVRRITRWTP